MVDNQVNKKKTLSPITSQFRAIYCQNEFIKCWVKMAVTYQKTSITYLVTRGQILMKR